MPVVSVPLTVAFPEAEWQAPATPTESLSPSASANWTTIMLRNLPSRCSRATVMAKLDACGFSGQYDFVYLPCNFKTHVSFGYAFINLVCPEQVESVWRHFHGFVGWDLPFEKPCEMGWSLHQGLAANIERYRNSPVMHPDVADAIKPILLIDGVQQAFLAPTCWLQTPKKACRRTGYKRSSSKATTAGQQKDMRFKLLFLNLVNEQR